MTGKKKLMIGGGIVIALGAIAFANFKFKKDPGLSVNTEAIQKRRLEAIVNASGKIQPKKSVNISADTSGRVTELVVNEGDLVKKGQFLLQIDPRNLRTRVTSGEASLSAARSQAEQLKLSMDTAKIALQQAENDAKRQRDLAKQGLTTREALDRAESELKTRQADMRTQQQQLRTQELRLQQESATLESARYDLNKVRIESPIDGIVTRRNIEAGETAIIGTMNNAGTVLLTIADMSVIETEVEVDETDIPNVAPRTEGQDHDRRHARTRRSRRGDGDRQQPDSGGRSGGGRPGDEFQSRVDGRRRDSRRFVRDSPAPPRSRPPSARTRSAVPIQAMTVREMVVDDKENIVRETQTGPPNRRPPAGAVQARSSSPGRRGRSSKGSSWFATTTRSSFR